MLSWDQQGQYLEILLGKSASRFCKRRSVQETPEIYCKSSFTCIEGSHLLTAQNTRIHSKLYRERKRLDSQKWNNLQYINIKLMIFLHLALLYFLAYK